MKDPERESLIQTEDSQKPHKTYGTFAAFAISVNYIIGTGVFGLPFAFYSSGILLGIICLSVSGFFSIMSINWVLEVLARTEGIVTAEKQNSFPVNQITWRKFDFTEIFELFGGSKGKATVWIAIACMCYGVLWAYGSVFSASVSSLFYQFVFNDECTPFSQGSTESCQRVYLVSLLAYACIVIPLACMDMGEQAIIQMCMTIYRFTAFGVMTITLITGLSYPRPNFNINGVTEYVPVSAFNFGGFATVFLSGAVALNFHYNVPDVVRPVQNKNLLSRIVSGAQFVAFSFYISLSILSAFYFGNSTQTLVTLNWRTFTGREGGWAGSLDDRPFYAVIVQLIVMIFPVLDMLSVFPLVAVTLGNNIYNILPSEIMSKFSEKAGRIISRLLAALPPLILASFFGSINQIFDIKESN